MLVWHGLDKSLLVSTVLLNQTRSQVSRIYHSVCGVLADAIINYNLCTNHLPRDEALSHRPIFTNIFFGDTMNLILDGASNDHPSVVLPDV